MKFVQVRNKQNSTMVHKLFKQRELTSFQYVGILGKKVFRITAKLLYIPLQIKYWKQGNEYKQEQSGLCWLKCTEQPYFLDCQLW